VNAEGSTLQQVPGLNTEMATDLSASVAQGDTVHLICALSGG
jgi:hypothetical protein